MRSPDKMTYKATVTHELRSFLLNLTGGECKLRYLKIGADIGYTACEVSHSYERITCVELDPARRGPLCRNIASHASPHVREEFRVYESSHRLPRDRYDVVLVDADHSYEWCKRDFENVIRVNVLEDFAVVFHDYGLVGAGVRKFVDELVTATGWLYEFCGRADSWNPLGGPVDGPEAACVWVKRS